MSTLNNVKKKKKEDHEIQGVISQRESVAYNRNHDGIFLEKKSTIVFSWWWVIFIFIF